ncbi:LOW QUALITY PROTEIN: serum paraoxonase/arylesterase 2-like [Clupea harengus]|uniref:Paraoxonase n=1 Tax=Clupea harengus TaxID=7950 RepID=A0A6P3VK55_CLUHA|nr:LOW QUALITY PROTEIN: serum paraoxonase/arylesterase 2-like [Clupea harengus]
MGKKVILISVIIAAFSAFLGERLMTIRKRCHATRELIPNHLPNCKHIKGLEYGSEDITMLPGGLALISTGLKYPGMPSFSDGPGKIYLLDIESDRKRPVELRMGRGFDLESFNPHGISVYTDADGAIHLFVVNHPQSQSQVEIFRFLEEENTLEYLKTIKHELLHSVNDIVALGAESFYATNDNYFSNGILKMLGLFLSLPWCTVVYYSPEEVKVVAEGFYMANGINVSPDKKHIYVADILDSKVHVMERQDSNDLIPVKFVDVGSLVDNIEVDPETGDLWLGCHPNAWKAFLNDIEDPPGSEVIKIENILSDQPTVNQVFMDDGSVIIGSSVATLYGGKVLIGSVYHRALCCDLK